MFCPKCGSPDQSPETFCRHCGVFLPDLSRASRRGSTAEIHIKINTILNALTIVASFTLSILLYAILGFRPGTHPLIYIAAAVFSVIGIWHIQTLIRTLALKKQLRKGKRPEPDGIVAPRTGRLLDTPDFENVVPPSVTDTTTRHLEEKVLR